MENQAIDRETIHRMLVERGIEAIRARANQEVQEAIRDRNAAQRNLDRELQEARAPADQDPNVVVSQTRFRELELEFINEFTTAAGHIDQLIRSFASPEFDTHGTLRDLSDTHTAGVKAASYIITDYRRKDKSRRKRNTLLRDERDRLRRRWRNLHHQLDEQEFDAVDTAEVRQMKALLTTGIDWASNEIDLAITDLHTAGTDTANPDETNSEEDVAVPDTSLAREPPTAETLVAKLVDVTRRFREETKQFASLKGRIAKAKDDLRGLPEGLLQTNAQLRQDLALAGQKLMRYENEKSVSDLYQSQQNDIRALEQQINGQQITFRNCVAECQRQARLRRDVVTRVTNLRTERDNLLRQVRNLTEQNNILEGYRNADEAQTATQLRARADLLDPPNKNANQNPNPNTNKPPGQATTGRKRTADEMLEE